MTLPAGYFEGQVKGYLKSVNDGGRKAVSGRAWQDDERQGVGRHCGQYRENAQFEDTLDFPAV